MRCTRPAHLPGRADPGPVRARAARVLAGEPPAAAADDAGARRVRRATAPSTRAYGRRRGLADRFPDRRPGLGRRRAAWRATVAGADARRTRLPRAQRSSHDGETIDGTRAAAHGHRRAARARSTSGIVVVAHRDAAGPRRRGRAVGHGGAARARAGLRRAAPDAAHADARLDERRQRRRRRRRGSSPTTSRGPVAARARARRPRRRATSRAAARRRLVQRLGATPLRLRATRAGGGAAPRPARRRRAPRALSQFARFAMPGDARRAGRAAGARAARRAAVDRRRPPAAPPTRRSRATRLEALRPRRAAHDHRARRARRAARPSARRPPAATC